MTKVVRNQQVVGRGQSLGSAQYGAPQICSAGIKRQENKDQEKQKLNAIKTYILNPPNQFRENQESIVKTSTREFIIYLVFFGLLMFGKEFLFHLNNIPEDLIFRRLTEIVSLFSHNDCRKCGRHHVSLYQSGPRSHIRVRRRGSGRNQQVEHNCLRTNTKCLPNRQIFKQQSGIF